MSYMFMLDGVVALSTLGLVIVLLSVIYQLYSDLLQFNLYVVASIYLIVLNISSGDVTELELYNVLVTVMLVIILVITMFTFYVKASVSARMSLVRLVQYSLVFFLFSTVFLHFTEQIK